MKEPHERLHELRKASFSTMREAVNRFGFHYQNYRDHERGRIKIKPEQAKVYARAFKTSAEYILLGKTPPSVKGDVGLISWVQAGAFAEVIDNFQPGDAEDWIDYPAKHSKIIALRVKGSSMNRISPDGSIIIVDLLDREMFSNRLYVIKVGNEATYKRFKANPPRLEPDSTEAHDTIFIEDVDAKPIGRVLRTMIDFN